MHPPGSAMGWRARKEPAGTLSIGRAIVRPWALRGSPGRPCFQLRPEGQLQGLRRQLGLQVEWDAML